MSMAQEDQEQIVTAFNGLSDLNDDLKHKRELLKLNTGFLLEKGKEKSIKLGELSEQLKEAENKYLFDTELMKKKYGCTNKEQREAKVKELTTKEQEAIKEYTESADKELEYFKDKIEDLKIEVEHIRWTLKIHLAYYKAIGE